MSILTKLSQCSTQRKYLGLVAILLLSTSLFFGIQFLSSADGGDGGGDGGVGVTSGVLGQATQAALDAANDAVAACGNTMAEAVAEASAAVGSFGEGGGGGGIGGGGCPCGTICTSVDPKGGGCFRTECRACPVSSDPPTSSDPPSSAVPPTASLTASPSVIANGESATLTWSSSGDVTSCSGSGFSTGGATSGSTSVSPTENTTYVVLCEGPAGSDSDTDDVEVSNPSAPPEIDADPSRVERGDTTSISWDENGHLGCSITGTNGDSIDITSSSPQVSDPIFGETTYTILCSDDSSSDDTIVTIIPEFEEF